MSFSLGDLPEDGDAITAPKAVCDINVTPFVDVMLVLLIVFMVTAPMLSAGVKVDLPTARGAVTLSPAREPLLVSVKADGSVFIGAEARSGEAFDATIKARVSADPDVIAHIRADAAVPYEKVLDAMASLSRDGVNHLAFIGKAEGGQAAP